MIKTFFLGFILPLFSLIQPDPYFITYDVENGLPSSEVYEIITDDTGLVWITTDRGVVSFDGNSFKLYTKKDGLTDNTNFHLYQDSKSKIWFSGFNKTLSYLENDTIRSFGSSGVLGETLDDHPGSWINHIFEDKQENYFLVPKKSSDKSIFKIDRNNEFSKIDNNELNELIIETKNECIIMFQIGDNLISFYEIPIYGHSNVINYNSRKAIRHKEWIVYGDLNSIYKSKIGNSTQSYRFPTAIEKIYIDYEGDLWVCTNAGLFNFQDADITSNPKVYFEDYLISTIAQDFQGNYWIGTNDSGIRFIPSFDIDVIKPKNESLKYNRVLTVCKQEDIIAFGTSNSKFIVVDKNNNCNVFQAPNTLKNEQINTILPWTYKNSFIIDKGSVFHSNTFKKQEKVEVSGKVPLEHAIVFFDNNDFVYFDSGYKFNIYQYVEGSGFKHKSLTQINEFKLEKAFQDQKNNIWLGTNKGLLLVKNHEYSNHKKILDGKGEELGRISSICEGQPDVIIATTIGNGAFIIKDETVVSIEDKVQLSSQMINRALALNDTILLLATNNGIDILQYKWKDKLELKFLYNLNYSDGLISNYINDIEYWNGYIWAATNNGICRFSPEGLNDINVPQIPIYISSFENKDSIYSLSQNLEFEHNQNDILITYNGLSFQQQKDKIEYKYRLIKDNEESSSRWYFTTDRNQRFNDLTAGEYLFEVNSKNKLRIWNDKPASIKFSIKPHFTQWLSFKLLIGSLFLFVTYLIYISQIRRIQRKQEREKELSKAKQKVQAAELASIRNQMNPHFVYNSLNSIQNLIFKNDKQGANHYLSKFSRLMRESLEFTSLDFISLDKEINFLKNYTDLESLRFPNRFAFNIHIDSDIDESEIFIPSLILQPIVENSIKHGFSNLKEKGELKIIIESINDNYLSLTVADNGHGSQVKTKSISNNKEEAHSSLGIGLVKNRLELLNQSKFDGKATFKEVISESGYTTTITLPFLQ